MKRMIDYQIPRTILRTEDTACPACNAPIDDARFQHCPFCGQRLNWVALPQESLAITSVPFVKTPSDVLDLIEAQSLEIMVSTNRLINFFSSFHAIFEASPEELCQVDGMSPSAALVTFPVLCYACHGKDLLWFSWFGHLLFYQISRPLPFYFSFFPIIPFSVWGFG